ncbi:MAG TPA: OsmC family protein [Longimicrobiales bacterium]|nr:OsmC family protein [Longimicrobiales bacterium]
MTLDARWAGDMRFEVAGRSDRPVLLDGDGEEGLTPMEALAASASGCMAIDVVDILSRMRIPPRTLDVRFEGDRQADPPRRYTAIRFVYRITGLSESDRPRVDRAVALSRNKYCSVLHTLQADLDISIRVELD